jgi:hypothetical protein
VTEVFVLAQRFDHLTFDHSDSITTRGAVDESGRLVTMENATNDRKTIGMSLAAPSLFSKGATPPNLIIRPLHQLGSSGRYIS